MNTVTNLTDATDDTTPEKNARLSCRIRPAVQEQAETAARILGQSVTDFAEAALEEKARAVLAQNERIVLSEHAFGEFLGAISGEPEWPSEKLLAAVAAYNRHEPAAPSAPATSERERALVPFVEFLSSHHERAGFDCGKEPLNRYQRQVARQGADRNLGVTHIIVPEPGAAAVLSYFTLVTRVVESAVVPEKRLPPGPIGVVLLGRLAVNNRYQRQGLGKRMLLRAMAEADAASRRISIYALVLDALDEEARSWYLGLDFGFRAVTDEPNRLYVPVSFIRQLGFGEITPEL